MMLTRMLSLSFLLALPVAHAEMNVLKLLQQYTQKPTTLGSPQTGDWSVTYMAFDTPLGFTTLVHLKGKKAAWVLRVEEPKVNLLKSFPSRASFKKFAAGENKTEYFKVTGGPFKGNTLEVIQDVSGSKRYSLITPAYATARKLTF